MSRHEFNRAVDFIRSPPGNNPVESSNDQKLKLYAHFKQATNGPCSQHGGAQPWAVKIEKRAKWDAWNGLGDMPQQEAMRQYVNILNQLVPNWTTSEL